MYVTLKKKGGILKVHLLCSCSKGREFQDLNQRQLITITLAIILKKLRYIRVVINRLKKGKLEKESEVYSFQAVTDIITARTLKERTLQSGRLEKL